MRSSVIVSQCQWSLSSLANRSQTVFLSCLRFSWDACQLLSGCICNHYFFLRPLRLLLKFQGGAASGFAGENKEPDNKDPGSTFPVCSVSIQAVRVEKTAWARYINLLLLFILMLLSSNDFSLSCTSKSEHQPRLFFYRKPVYWFTNNCWLYSFCNDETCTPHSPNCVYGETISESEKTVLQYDGTLKKAKDSILKMLNVVTLISN